MVQKIAQVLLWISLPPSVQEALSQFKEFRQQTLHDPFSGYVLKPSISEGSMLYFNGHFIKCFESRSLKSSSEY